MFFLLFSISNEVFAVEINEVLEVVELENITRIPKSPEILYGITNYRGEMLSVIDFRSTLGFDTYIDKKTVSVVVIDFKISKKKQLFGFIAESVIDVCDFPETQVEPVCELGLNFDISFLKGMSKYNEQIIHILDIQNIFMVANKNIKTV